MARDCFTNHVVLLYVTGQTEFYIYMLYNLHEACMKIVVKCRNARNARNARLPCVPHDVDFCATTTSVPYLQLGKNYAQSTTSRRCLLSRAPCVPQALLRALR